MKMQKIVSWLRKILYGKLEKELSEANKQVQLLAYERNLFLGQVEDRERLIINYRFGINMNRNYTLEEIGNRLGVTRERIRQIEAKTLRKLSQQNKFRRLNEH